MLNLLLLLLLHPTTAVKYSARALQDKITTLPGLDVQPTFQMFSGYIDVSTTQDASKQMFYWFVESQNSPSTDPVFLWTNGGPGCSGLGGFMTEQGPFRPTANGTSLTINKFYGLRQKSMPKKVSELSLFHIFSLLFIAHANIDKLFPSMNISSVSTHYSI